MLFHGNPLRDDQGRLIGQMAFITDLTEQKKALTLAGEVQRSLLPRESHKVHGLDIALLMTSACAFLRMHASRDESIGEIVRSMNSHVAVDVMESGIFPIAL